MSSFQPANSQSTYLPVEFSLPDDPKQAQDFIIKRERQTADILNVKENGSYELIELLSGQQWFSTATGQEPKKTRYAYRYVMDLVAKNSGPIPAGLSSFAHGL